jgi:hypothetical protein
MAFGTAPVQAGDERGIEGKLRTYGLLAFLLFLLKLSALPTIFCIAWARTPAVSF